MLEITERSPFKFETIHTLSLESIQTNTLEYLEYLGISTKVLIEYLEESITSVRSIISENYDELMKSVFEKMEKDESVKIEKYDNGKVLLVTSKLPVVRKLLFLRDVGLNFESLIAEAIDKTYISDLLDKELSLLSEKINNLKDDFGKYVDRPGLEGGIEESYIIRRCLKEYSEERIVLKGVSKRVNIKVSNEVYLISHFDVADLSMIED